MDEEALGAAFLGAADCRARYGEDGNDMPFSESLAARSRDVLAREHGITEKKMFGGLCFLLHGKLLVGVFKDSLIVRLGTEQAPTALNKPHVGVFDITGRPMKGWVLVGPEGLDRDADLKGWIRQALDFVATLI